MAQAPRLGIRIYLNADNIKIKIAKKNKDLTWLADRMEISRGYLSMLLSGQKSPRPEKREKIQRALGLSWDELFKMTNTSREIDGLD